MTKIDGQIRNMYNYYMEQHNNNEEEALKGYLADVKEKAERIKKMYDAPSIYKKHIEY